MAYDFPASPTEGQVYTPSGGPTYVYYSPAWTARDTVAVRERLTANRTYYVNNTTGNDTTMAGTSAAAPFKTVQKAYDTIALIDGGGFAATISIADGTYSGNLFALKPLVGFTSLNITGNTASPSNVIHSGQFSIPNLCVPVVNVGGVRFGGTVTIGNGAYVTINGACHLHNAYFYVTNGMLSIAAIITITSTAGGACAFQVEGTEAVVWFNSAMSMATAPNYTTGFIYVTYGGTAIAVSSAKPTGTTLPGKRYAIGIGGKVIFNSTIDQSYFPGTTAGTVDAQGSMYGHFPLPTGMKETLSAARTYYIRTDGVDTNDGLTNSAGGAWRTFTNAATKLSLLHLNGKVVTVQVADGTYVESPTFNYGGPDGCDAEYWSTGGGGQVVFIGNVTTPANVVLNGTATVYSPWRVLFNGMTVSSIYSYGTSHVAVSNLRITAQALMASNGGTLFIRGPISTTYASGQAVVTLYLCGNAVFCGGVTFTAEVPLTVTQGWLNMFYGSMCDCVAGGNIAVTGTVTGPKFNCQLSSNLRCQANLSYFPGSTAGTSGAGGAVW